MKGVNEMFNSQALHRIRTQRGLSQAALAKEVGVGQSAISQFESGDVQPSLKTLQRLATVLQVPVTELLTEEPRDKPEDHENTA
jgi:transcriptional regulator with XRE-family HTH domain